MGYFYNYTIFYNRTAAQNNHIVMRFAVGSDLHNSEEPRETSWEEDLNNLISGQIMSTTHQG